MNLLLWVVMQAVHPVQLMTSLVPKLWELFIHLKPVLYPSPALCALVKRIVKLNENDVFAVKLIGCLCLERKAVFTI